MLSRRNRITALILIASAIAASVTSCADTDAPPASKTSETVVITAVDISETTAETSEEQSDPSDDASGGAHEGESIDLMMYAIREGVIKNDPSLRGEVIAEYTAGTAFHVIGTVRHYYAVELPDGSIGYVIMTKMSEEDQGIEGEITFVEDNEESEETGETGESSESESEDTSDGSDLSASTSSDQEGASSADPAPEPQPEPASSGPDLSVTYNGNSISSYDVDGYGTVYGYYVDTSYFNSLVNSHRSELGLPEWNFTSSDGTRIRAVECTVSFDHTRPNGESALALFDYSGGEIICTTTDNSYAYDLFMGSDGHRGVIEDSQYSFPNACSAAFVRVDWVDGSWQYNSSSLVCNCW